MKEVIGFIKNRKSYMHKIICSHCGAIIQFSESDIIRDDM